MEKIRVLHCLQTIGSGGVERRRLSLAKLLDQEKYILKIICTTVDGSFYKEFEKHGVEILPVGILKNPFQLSIHNKVSSIIDEFQPHIIHGAVFEGVTMAAINGFFKRVPIIILEETSDPITRSWKANYLLKAFSMVADKVIGVSPAATKYLTEKAKVSKQKVKLINNGVAVPRIVTEQETNDLLRKIGVLPQEVIIGSVGRMVQDEHKRFSDLIKAFELLIKKGVNAKLILIGDGPELDVYKELAASFDISENIIFTGYISDVAMYYSIFDIFALVSAYESFGLVLAEAMLHKLPIVATRVGGMKYIVKNKKTGFLVERFNVKEITEKLDCLINNEQLRKNFGNAGYVRALENYTEETYVKKVESLYMHLAKKKNLI